jgi:hypothetical protein
VGNAGHRANESAMCPSNNVAVSAAPSIMTPMARISRIPKEMTQYQVTVAGEAFGAMLFSHAGYDVSLQYGTTQPGWDLIAVKGKRTLLVSVKGSQDGGWGLFQSYKKGRTFHGAVDAWRLKWEGELVFLLVQFQGVAQGCAPRAYLARPDEIVTHMRSTRSGNGQTCLHENYTYSSGVGAGFNDVIPSSWKATKARLDSV